MLILQGLQPWCLKPGFSSDLQCYFDLNFLLSGDGLSAPSTANFCLQLPHFPHSVKHLLSSGSSGIDITATVRHSNTRAMSTGQISQQTDHQSINESDQVQS